MFIRRIDVYCGGSEDYPRCTESKLTPVPHSFWLEYNTEPLIVPVGIMRAELKVPGSLLGPVAAFVIVIAMVSFACSYLMTETLRSGLPQRNLALHL